MKVNIDDNRRLWLSLKDINFLLSRVIHDTEIDGFETYITQENFITDLKNCANNMAENFKAFVDEVDGYIAENS